MTEWVLLLTRDRVAVDVDLDEIRRALALRDLYAVGAMQAVGNHPERQLYRLEPTGSGAGIYRIIPDGQD